MRVLDRIRALAAVLPRGRRHKTDFVGALVRRPQLLLATGAYETALVLSARVDPPLKQLAELKVAAVVACEYCLDIGSALGRVEGLTEDQLCDLAVHRDSPAYDDTERLVLDVAEALTRVPAVLDDDLRRRFEATFGVAERAELLSVIAWENHRARLNQGLGVRPSGFSNGEYCALPQLA